MKGGVSATDRSLGNSRFKHLSHSDMSLDSPVPHAGTNDGFEFCGESGVLFVASE